MSQHAPKELIEEIAHEVKVLEVEAEEGASARTPLIVLGGVTMVVGAVVVTLLVVAFLAYYLAK
jgi:hypothetical protein